MRVLFFDTKSDWFLYSKMLGQKSEPTHNSSLYANKAERLRNPDTYREDRLLAAVTELLLLGHHANQPSLIATFFDWLRLEEVNPYFKQWTLHSDQYRKTCLLRFEEMIAQTCEKNPTRTEMCKHTLHVRLYSGTLKISPKKLEQRPSVFESYEYTTDLSNESRMFLSRFTGLSFLFLSCLSESAIQTLQN